jgi:hypothetical protein
MSAEGERSMLDGNAAGGLLSEVFAFRCNACAEDLRGLRQDPADGGADALRHRARRHSALPVVRPGGRPDRAHVAGTLAGPARCHNRRSC